MRYQLRFSDLTCLSKILVFFSALSSVFHTLHTWEKFPGTLESAQTSFADSGQADDSFANVRSQTKCAPNFRALYVRSGAYAGEGLECSKFPGTLESAQTSSADSGQVSDSLASVRS